MDKQNERKLALNLSGTGAWAFALGTSIGWGSLVVTSSTWLAKAGPAGSVLGLTAGALIMLLIGRNYAYLMNCYPEAGGAYAFCREAFGYDHGFLAAWFLGLTYLAILWANATSLPLFARYFLGDVFKAGRLYVIFGYEVYLGEALLSAAFILVTAFLCAWWKDAAVRLMIGMVLLFAAGITICFCGAVFRHGAVFTPAFVPEKNVLGQVVRVTVMSPWAFIGFECISHGTEEFSFSRKKSFRIMVLAVVSATLLYIFVTLLSVTAYPEGYGSWLAYIRDLGNLGGIEALPAFYAANHYLGTLGTGLLMLSLLALILTSLIGNLTALSRLFYALGRDGILPASVGRPGRRNTPAKAIVLIVCISVIIPFLGRTAIGWIVDVTMLGATLTYGFVSAAAYKEARFRHDLTEKRTGLAGLVIMVGFGLYLLVPNLFTTGSMEPESYFLFVAWAVLGFFIFRRILKRDEEGRFGRSIIVWIALLSLILFVSLVWMNQSIMSATDRAMRAVETFYNGTGEAGLSGAAAAEGAAGVLGVQTGIVGIEMQAIRAVSARSISVVVLIFALSLAILMNNYRLMSRQAENSRKELGLVRDMAGRDALTGVRNKLAYSETEKKLDESIASGTAGSFAIAVLDVNGLKHVNDTQGHQAGDEYIKKAGRMICMYFAHSPVFRTGGDEFTVLLRDRDYEERETILDMFRKESEAHIASKDVVISIGCTDYDPLKDQHVHSIFERADALMYEHKKQLKSKGAATRL